MTQHASILSSQLAPCNVQHIRVSVRHVTHCICDSLYGMRRTGTVTNVKEACAWLSYTYLFVRMLKNPLAYGVSWEEIASDPRLEGHRKTLITTAARQLEKWAFSLYPLSA